MEQENKIRLEAAMALWKEKGNVRLAEACAIALEYVYSKDKNKKSSSEY